MASGISVATNMPTHHRGLYDVIDLYPKKKQQNGSRIIGRKLESKDAYEEIALISGLAPAGKIKEFGGVPFDEFTTPYTKQYPGDIFAIGVEISNQAFRKDVNGAIAKRAPMMAISMYVASEQSDCDVINFADNASYTGPDGVALAATTHPTDSSTWSNITTAAAPGATCVENMVTDFMLQKAFRGGVYWQQEGPFRLVSHPTNRMTYQKVFESVSQPFTTNNEKNVVRGYLSDLITTPYLTDTNMTALIADGDENPLFKFEYQPLMIDEDKDITSLSRLFVASREWVNGWFRANGFQYNAGA